MDTNKSSLWTSGFILICLSNTSAFMAFHGLLPTLSLYIQNLGGSKTVSGLALAVLTVAAVIARPLTGWALDNYGRKFIISIGLLMFLIPTLIFISEVGIIPLLLLRLWQGFAWGISSTSQGTVASDLIPPERIGQGLGYFSITTTISLAIAPSLGLWLVDAFSFEILFLSLSILTLASLFFAIMIKYPKPTTPSMKTKLVFLEIDSIPPSLIALLATIPFSAVALFLPLFARQMGLSTAGLFFTAMAVSSVVARPVSGIIVDKKGRQGYDIVVFTCLTLLIISMLLLARISSSWFLVLSGSLYGIGVGALHSSMMALSISSVPPERRGAANATYWTAIDIGVAVGSLSWGIIANYFGYAVMFNMNSVPLTIAFAIYWFTRKKIPVKS